MNNEELQQLLNQLIERSNSQQQQLLDQMEALKLDFNSQLSLLKTEMPKGSSHISGSGFPRSRTDQVTIQNFDSGVAVQNTWYPAPAVTGVLKGLMLSISPTVANETLECRLTVDGTLYNCAAGQAITAGNSHCVFLRTNCGVASLLATIEAAATTYVSLFRYDFLPCKSLMVEVRKTTAAGASHLLTTLAYSKES